MEILFLLLFAAILVACVLSDISILAAMACGYALFLGYGLLKKHSLMEMLFFSVQGIKTVKNILITFILIGMLTAVWRACGSIAFIVYHASSLCVPSLMLLFTFLLCSLISFLTGTAFGSAATIGIICMTMASGMGIPAVYTGGAVLSGVYFGDRCSPVSTSALLVSELTKTDLLHNIKGMVRTSVVPFCLACAAYLLLGRTSLDPAAASQTVSALFQSHYELSALTLIPVIAVLLLAFLHANVKITLAVSAALGAVIAIFIQQIPMAQLFMIGLNGFQPADPALAVLMGGGGIISMVRVFCIVCISSCYAGIFHGTGFLDGMQRGIHNLAQDISNFGTTALIAVAASGVACNQTLAIMLTHQLCSANYADRPTLAADLENTAVVIAPLIPWSIAGCVPLATVSAPVDSIAFAFYLLLIPIWNLLCGGLRSKLKP